MKKIVTGVTLSAAAVGLSLVAVATPASAVEAPQNCGELYALGYSHVPAGHEWYLPKLDRNEDGIGCEYNVEYGVIVEGREQAAAAEIAVLVAAEQSASEDGDGGDQVAVVPVGAADTGVAPAGDPAAALTLGTLGLAAVAGAAVVARRRVQA